MKAYKLSEEIKQQIDERKMQPNRDLWSEIEDRLEESKAPKKKYWPTVAAAVVLVAVGLTVYKVQMPKAETAQDKVQVFSQHSEPKATPIDETVEVAAQKIAVNEASKEKTLEPVEPIPLPQQIRSAEPSVKKLDPALPKIAVVDTVETAPRKSYVDPKTLMFSVENREGIEKTKDAVSNVATINLNK